MYGSYESTQSVEIETDGEYHEAEFDFLLDCVYRGCAAQLYGPPENCYAAEAAEFELNSVHVLDPDGKSLKISDDILAAILGKERADKLIAQAQLDAQENYEDRNMEDY